MAPDLRSIVDPQHTVLLLQECQKGVIGDLSALPEMAAAAKVTMIPNVARLAEGARAAGVRVIHATAAHQPDMWGANTNARLFHGAKRSPVKLVMGVEAVEAVRGTLEEGPCNDCPGSCAADLARFAVRVRDDAIARS